MLEVIGLSVTFALLGLRVTGDGADVSKEEHTGCILGVDEDLKEGCMIYSWIVILNYLPISITIVSLLMNAIVASPKGFMERHVLRKCYWQEWLYVILLALWILEPVAYELYGIWTLTSGALFFALYAIGLVTWVIFKMYKIVFCRGSDSWTKTSISILWTSSASIVLFYLPAGLFLSLIVERVLAYKIGLAGSSMDMLDHRWDPFFLTEALGHLVCKAWMVWCLLRKGSLAMASLPRSMAAVVAEEHNILAESHERWFRRLSPSINLLLGWVHLVALHTFIYLCWSEYVISYIIRTKNYWFYFALPAIYWFVLLLAGVCAAATKTKGVAFWFVAKVLLDDVVFCTWILREAVRDGIIIK